MIARRQPDYRFMVVFAILILLGFVMLSSASAVIGFDRFGDSYYFLKRQLIAGGLGLIIFLILLRLDYRLLKPLALPIFVVSLVLLLLIYVPGIGQSYGTFAKRWVRFGLINFQPSEFVKLTLLIYLSAWLANRGKIINNFMLTFLPFAAMVTAVVGLIIFQPDIGTAFIVSTIALGVYYVAGGKLFHLSLLMAVGLMAFFVLINFSAHASDRLKIFLHPELDPQGIGYHINQAYLAIGSGGLWGRGFGQSRAKFQYLPEVYGDSIFAVIAEEFGFIVVTIFLLLLLYLLYRGLSIARAAPDDFGRFLGGGIILWFVGQSLVNISAMVGLLPLTGIPLPFISYGSSAMVSSMAALGILANISIFRRKNL